MNLFKIPLVVEIFWHSNSIIYHCLQGFLVRSWWHMPPWRIEHNIQPKIYLLLIKSKRQGIQEHVIFDIFPQWLRVELNLQLMLHFKTLKMSTYTRTNLFDICSHWGLNSRPSIYTWLTLYHWAIEAMHFYRCLYLSVNLFKMPLVVDIYNILLFAQLLDDIGPHEGLNLTFNQRSYLLLIINASRDRTHLWTYAPTMCRT